MRGKGNRSRPATNIGLIRRVDHWHGQVGIHAIDIRFPRGSDSSPVGLIGGGALTAGGPVPTRRVTMRAVPRYGVKAVGMGDAKRGVNHSGAVPGDG